MTQMGDLFADEIYVTGDRVCSGTYRQVGSTREVTLEQAGTLPTGADGHPVGYTCVQYLWDYGHSRRPGTGTPARG